MNKPIIPMTKEELEKRTDIPEVYKKAIERSIWESVLPEEPEDRVWPDYFRAEEVACLLECELRDDDPIDEDEYGTECGWFESGWKAREEIKQGKLGL